MVKHSQYIIINANIEKSWAFLIDLSRSLIFDKFYLRIELPGKYSINKNYTFNVNAKYFFNNYKLKAEIKEVIAPSTFSIQLIDKGIFHKKNFILEPLNNKTKLIYNFNGKFGGGLKNTIISPIIKFSCINEIRYIKKAIESSEFYTNNEKINTVSSYK